MATLEIMTRLRQETLELHRSIETLPFNQALLTQTLPLSLYIAQLVNYLPIHHAIETYCAQTFHSVVQKVWHPKIAKTHLLIQDIAYFRQHYAIPTYSALTTEFLNRIKQHHDMNSSWLLGGLYVLVGSSLGANLLLPHLQNAYLLQTEGLRYYGTILPWPLFKKQMNNAIIELTDQESVVMGARDMFEHIGSVLTNLWENATSET